MKLDQKSKVKKKDSINYEFSEYSSSGRYAITSCANLLTQGPLHGIILLLISKPAFYRWLNFAISGGFITAEMDFHDILHQRHVALPIENAAMTMDCMLLRYQIYKLTSCEFVDDLQMGVSIDFRNYGCALVASRTVCCPPATLLSSPWYRCFCILAHGLDC